MLKSGVNVNHFFWSEKGKRRLERVEQEGAPIPLIFTAWMHMLMIG